MFVFLRGGPKDLAAGDDLLVVRWLYYSDVTSGASMGPRESAGTAGGWRVLPAACFREELWDLRSVSYVRGSRAAAGGWALFQTADMSGLKPRNRLVNFRLTEDEYGRLAAVCARKGSPSISDFARAAILRTIEAEAGREGLLDTVLTALGDRLSDLERNFRGLAEPAGDNSRRNPAK